MKALTTPVTPASVHTIPKPPPPPVTMGDAQAAAVFGGDVAADPQVFDGVAATKSPVFDAASKPLAPVVAPKSRAELRRLFLEQSAVTLGQSWADQWRDDLRREGRPAAGGWPGTLREARVRVEHHLLAEVTRRKMSAVTEAEREVAARKAYASARAQWCRQAEPEAP